MNSRYVFSVALCFALSACHGLGEPSARPMAGQGLFDEYCAGCHGIDAKGDGPYAPYLKTAPPDLTLMFKRRGGDMPDEEIFKIIDGQSLDHWSQRHMPVWGYEFYGDQSDDREAHAEATRRVWQLVAYVKSVQRK